MRGQLDEKSFEVRIRNLVTDHVLPNNRDLILMESKKAVDILICKNGKEPALFFIEVKYHQQRHNRLGFGSGKGVGFQPEILTRNPDYFDQNMRWIIGDDDHLDDQFLFLNNRQLSEYLSGGSIGKKFNNIQKRLLKEGGWIDVKQLISGILSWTN